VNGIGSTSVLVRVSRNPGSYRAAAAEPIALVADTVEASIQPLRTRRTAAAMLLAAMLLLSVAASAVQSV
jgi:hypothetical protein